MIVYRELSSLEKDLGVSAKMLYTLSNQRHRHYRSIRIPKGNGEYRELSVPDEFLKAVQTRIARNLLAYEPISPYFNIGSCSPAKNHGMYFRIRKRRPTFAPLVMLQYWNRQSTGFS